MIVDTSAIIAIVFREAGYAELLGKLSQAPSLGAGTPTLAETAIVLSARLARDAQGLLERFLQEFAIQPIPFGQEHWRAAHAAYAQFGKGRHPARLNFGDCLTYATAKLANRPLLCVGGDFARTDLALA